MQKRNILIVTSEFPPQPGGIGNHAYNLARFLSKNDYEVQLIADQRSDRGVEETHFDDSLPFKISRIKKRQFRLLMYLDRIRVTMSAYKMADTIIATGKFSLWNVAFCSLFLKRRTIAVIHGTEVNFKSAFLKWAVDTSLKTFDAIIAVSNYTKELVAHLNLNVIVIPNGIDLDNWQPLGIKSQPKERYPILTTVGRVSARKGQIEVIQLLPNLVTIYPNLHYHCIGIPTEAKACMELASALGVADHVTFHGSLPETDLRRRLAATDIFMMLSSESDGDVEGFGIAILEANAMGVPAIGSLGCGIEDAISNELSGRLVPLGQSDAFQQAVENILEHQKSYSENAIQWSKQHGWDHLIKDYIKIIHGYQKD